MRKFVVAENPDENSRLPFLLRVPVGTSAELLFKAGDRWPRTARVYCHPLEPEAWPEDAAILEEIPVRACTRRGAAIDLLLDRGRENRSQFVFTRLRGGRPGVLWQTAKTTKTARPGARVPKRRAAGMPELRVLVDTRERYPYRFAKQKAITTERQSLPAGDYGIEVDGQLVAVVERKSAENLAGSLVDGSMQFQLADLASLPRAAVVVESRYTSLAKLEHANTGWVLELLARVQVRYPHVPIVFCETRPFAEDWTYRFLGAAAAEITEDA